MSRNLVLIVILLFWLSCFLHTGFNQYEVRAPNGYPVHNLNTGLNYTSIQEAIDAPETLNGHTISVGNGIYYEYLVISKSVSLIGENRSMTIIDGQETGNVVIITASNVYLSGFTIRNSGWPPPNSCLNVASSNNTIIENTINGGSWGILLDGSHENLISQNNISNNYVGIVFLNSNSNAVSDNNISSNIYAGVYLNSSDHNEFSYNTVFANPDGGIYLEGSEDNYIFNNYVNYNGGWHGGVEISGSRGNLVVGNTFSNSSFGIGLFNTGGNYILGNTLSHNQRVLNLRNSSDNRILHNNFIDNYGPSYIRDASLNYWDNGIEGNYWSDYNGTDTDDDGIGEVRYEIDASNTDHYPLMGMFSSFNTSIGYNVNVISNSTIDSFEYSVSANTMSLLVSNSSADQTFGFVRICIPHTIMNETYHVTVNDTEPYYVNYNIADNGTHRWIYFEYEHSTLEIVVIPEFPTQIILPLFMTSTLVATLLCRKRRLQI